MNLPDNFTLQGGKYRIIRFISSGGFGCTYEAVHVLFHKRVAIKEFFVKDFCNRNERSSYVTVATQSKVKLVERLKKKFLEEAGVMNSMQHPNIVHVIDVFEENNTAYYVMDYIDGKSLQEIIKEKGVLKENMALKYIFQIAEALKYVHSLNRLHLDIKPGNIMINNNDNAILIDFGASKQYDEVDGENTSTLIGKTPGYAPLEQLGNEVSRFLPATDIYALGATLYKLVTGKTPISVTLLASGEDLELIPQSISSSTRKAIYAAMEINKKMRPQSIDAFLNILKGVGDNEDIIIKDSDYYNATEETIMIRNESDNLSSTEQQNCNNTTIESYIKSVEQGDVLEQYGFKNYCYELYYKAVKQGNASAQNNVGFCYYYGKGISKDYFEAVKWYRKSAEQGNASAQNNLGDCYYYGKGIAQDYFEAVKWYLKSAEQGNASAQNNLGDCYYYGKGIAQDYFEAVKWYRKSAEQGNASAQNNLGLCYYNGFGVSQDYSKAVEWYRKSAEQGYSYAQAWLGYCYYYGQGISKDYFNAFEWYRKSAEQGNAWAQNSLGNCYYYSHGVSQDYVKAFEWYRKSAEQGNAVAQYNLGICYYYGHGVSKDYSKAVEWYRKAAKQGNKDAKYKLEGLGESLE